MPTTNPVPSTDPTDLLFNAGKLDEAINSTSPTYTDRRGVQRRTLTGLEAEFPNAAANAAASAASAVDAADSAQTAQDEAAVATAQASAADASRVAAETARDAAQLSAGVYASTAIGLAATTSGEYFSVPSASSDEYLILYQNSGGTAVEVKRYVSLGVDGADTFSAAREQSADGKVLGYRSSTGVSGARIFNARQDVQVDGESVVLGKIDSDREFFVKEQDGAGIQLGHITKSGWRYVPYQKSRTFRATTVEAESSLTIGGIPAKRFAQDAVDSGVAPYLLEAADYALSKAVPAFLQRTRILEADGVYYKRMKNPNVIQTGANRFLVLVSAQQQALESDPDRAVGTDVGCRVFTVDAVTNAVTMEAQRIVSPVNLDPEGAAAPAGYSWSFVGLTRNDTTGRINFIAKYTVAGTAESTLESARYFAAYTDNEFTTYTITGEVTSVFKQPGVYSTSMDNIGVRLKYGPNKGRIVISGYSYGVSITYRSCIFYSDDEGATWVRGASAYKAYYTFPDTINETSVTQLINGDIVMIARAVTAKYKYAFVSKDGGVTFDRTLDFVTSTESGVLENGNVSSAICQADSFTSIGGRKTPRVLYSGPDNPSVTGDAQRINGTVYVSYDNGRTFNRKYRVTTGYFGYSQVFPVRGDLIGVISEGVGFNTATTELDLVSIKNLFEGS